jgi:hypothetical protein
VAADVLFEPDRVGEPLCQRRLVELLEETRLVTPASCPSVTSSTAGSTSVALGASASTTP